MEQKTYSKVDALKMMIDGELMTAEGGAKGSYLKFDGLGFNLYRRADDSLWLYQPEISDEGVFVKYTLKPNFKVGDRVKCERWGRGEVSGIVGNLRVTFNTQPLTFVYTERDLCSGDIDVRLSLDTDYLGTTVDGVDIYGGYEESLYYGDKVRWIVRSIKGVTRNHSFRSNENVTGFFSTEKAAQEWVNTNKPKEIVGTTLDGVEIEKGEIYTLWSVDKEGEVFDACTAWDQEDFTGGKHYCLALGYQRFSTQAAAEDWKKTNLVGVTEDGWHVWEGEVRVLYFVEYCRSVVVPTDSDIVWCSGKTPSFTKNVVVSNYFKSKEAAQDHLDEYLASKIIYPKDSCIVVQCDIEDFSMCTFINNHVYKVKEAFFDNSADLLVYLDSTGSDINGIKASYLKHINVEAATEDQTKAYELSGKPIHIDEAEEILKPKVRFEVGSAVVHPGYGEGTVTKIGNGSHGIEVKFDNRMAQQCFTFDGRFSSADIAPTLTFKPGTKPFKVGRKVKCLMFGEGVVKRSESEGNWPIHVDFINSSSGSYTLDGRWTGKANPTLFHIVD